MNKDKASILWIHGDEHCARQVFTQYHFGYWSGSFSLLLDKHGWLDYDEETSFDILEDPDAINCYALIIVSWLPANRWKMIYLRTLRTFDGMVFLEGPFPKFLCGYLGIEAISSKKSFTEGVLHFASSSLKTYLNKKYVDIFASSLDKIRFEEKSVLTKKRALTHDDLPIQMDDSLSSQIQKIVLSYLLAFQARYSKNKAFFSENTLLDTVTQYVFIVFLEKCQNNSSISDPFLLTLTESLFGQPREQANEIEKVIADLKISVFAKLQKITQGMVWAVTWRIVSQIDKNRSSDLSDKQMKFLLMACKKTSKLRRKTDILFYYLIAYIISHLSDARQRNILIKKVLSVVHSCVSFAAMNNTITMDMLAENSTTYELLISAGILKLIDFKEPAESLLQLLINTVYDKEKHAFRNLKKKKSQFVSTTSFNYLSTPWVCLAIMVFIEQFAIEDKSPRFVEDFSEKQINAWKKPPYWVTAYRNVGGINLLEIENEGKHYPLIFQRGRIMGTTTQLLSYLVHYHTMHPLEEPLADCFALHTMILEDSLFSLIAHEMQKNGLGCLRVAPWPWKKKYALTIRHDVDRIPAQEQFDQLIRYEKAQDLGVSWYWLSDRLDSSKMSRAIEADQEVGLHARFMGKKTEELRALKSKLKENITISGENCHGGGGGDYWLGYLSVKAAKENGFLYTEFMPTIYNFPYCQFPYVDTQGVVRSINMVGITHAASADTLRRKVHNRLLFARTIALAKGHCMILNHPDVNFEKLKQWVAELPDNRVNWTCSQVAHWWRKTHCHERLEIRRIFSDSKEICFSITANEPIVDLELRFAIDARKVNRVLLEKEGVSKAIEWETRDDGLFYEIGIRLSLFSKEPVNLHIHCDRRARYDEIYHKLEHNVQGPNVEPKYHLNRVSTLMQVVNRYTTFKNFDNVNLADVGCGYGPYTIALHNLYGCKTSVGLDILERYIQVARQLTNSLNLSNIAFHQSEMQTINHIVSDLDLLVVNNSINFLNTRKKYRQALQAFYSSLKKNGYLIILTPNRLYYREAFTRVIGLQFWPKRLANWYVKKKKLRETYVDIRLPSPFELVRWLWLKGFREVRVIDAYRLNTKGWKRFFKPRFYITAKKV